MAEILKKPKGTQDILPSQVYKWHTVEKVLAETAKVYGFSELRVPTFENTALFKRSVGDTTDVTQKEMYSVFAKSPANGKESIDFSLRPEGTAGAARAMIENGLLTEALPQKIYYNLSCFRHEKPQAGRLREFHQFGAEMYGSAMPIADAQVISLVDAILKRLGITDIVLEINSIGCPVCRAKYHKELKAYFESRKTELCHTCLERLETNPMRILDCKSEICREIGKDAPVILDYLCEECSEHFEKVKSYLDESDISYVVNPKIVRGLDYYTKTVFEFISNKIGAQGTICAGGRYDGLIEQIGGKSTPALGFAMGLERIIMTMENCECEFLEPETPALFIATLSDEYSNFAVNLATKLRNEGFYAEYDLVGRTFKAQMKYANKTGAKFLVVIGEDEVANKSAKIKNMKTGESLEISLGDKFIEQFSVAYMGDALGDFSLN